MSISDMGVLPNGNLRITSSEHGEITLTRWTIQPLDLDALNRYIRNESVQIYFTDLCALEDAKITAATVTAQIPDLLKSYCLVKGGWLPPGFGMLKRSIFVDRNFVSRLGSHFKDNVPIKQDLAGWFNDLREFDCSFDILPYALEANSQQFPSRDDIATQVEEARAKLTNAAPGVRITQYPEPIEDYAWKLINGLKPTIEERMAFLVEVAPHVKPCFATEKVIERWSRIAEIAAKYNLKTDIITFLAMIAVSAPPKDSPGLGILKITHPYSKKAAYNACLDISIMELFLNLQRKDPLGQYAIITRDAPFARLGGLMNLLNYGDSLDGILKLNTTISGDLFENQEPELRTEFQRLFS